MQLVDGEDPHIAPRREFNAFAPARANVLHCYGVDFLSNKELLGIFAEFEPKDVEWLDDSSCNVTFAADGIPSTVMQSLSLGEQLEEPWIRTKPLTLSASAQEGKKVAQREFQLQLRVATEADRKDPGHSGHTDSVYYAHVKEQQSLQRQAAELRHAKKRQRQSRFPVNGESTACGSRPATPRTPLRGGAVSSSFGTFAPAAAVATGVVPGAGLSAPGQLAAAAATTEQSAAPGPLGLALPSDPAVRLGCRGPLDPLLFLRATPASTVAEAVRAAPAPEDLGAALRRAEAEYASVLPPKSAGTEQGRHTVRGRPHPGPGGRTTGRCRDGTSGRGPARGEHRGEHRGEGRTAGRTQGAQQREAPGRGRKRRPTEQEPRPVSDSKPPQRGLRAFPEVEAFLARHHVRCQRFALRRTFRFIMHTHQKKMKERSTGGTPALGEPSIEGVNGKLHAAPEEHDAQGLKDKLPSAAVDPAKGATAGNAPALKEDLPPWDQYLAVNSQFARKGQFVHTVAWEATGRRILTVVPHPSRVDMERLARAVQKPVSCIKLRKLQEIAKDTGFPSFVCPPFGHPKDSQGREPVLLIDSMVTELKKPLLFDCGSIGLCIPVSEFLRSTHAACVEQLVKAPKASGPVLEPPTLTPATTPEPAPEPAPVAPLLSL